MKEGRKEGLMNSTLVNGWYETRERMQRATKGYKNESAEVSTYCPR
jgi:hypothetical protein